MKEILSHMDKEWECRVAYKREVITYKISFLVILYDLCPSCTLAQRVQSNANLVELVCANVAGAPNVLFDHEA